MTEVFDSEFHKRYVGGEGEIKPPKETVSLERNVVKPLTIKDIEEEYRWYMNDSEARLPDDLVNHLLSIGTEDGREN